MYAYPFQCICHPLIMYDKHFAGIEHLNLMLDIILAEIT